MSSAEHDVVDMSDSSTPPETQSPDPPSHSITQPSSPPARAAPPFNWRRPWGRKVPPKPE